METTAEEEQQQLKIVFKTTSGVEISNPDAVHTVPLTYTIGDLKDYIAQHGVLKIAKSDDPINDLPRGTLKFIHSGRIVTDDAVQLKDIVASRSQTPQIFYVFYRPYTPQPPSPPSQDINNNNNNNGDNNNGVNNGNNDNNGDNNENNVRVIRININLGLILRVGLLIYLLVKAFKKHLGFAAVLIVLYLLNKIGILGWFWRVMFPMNNNNNNNNNNTNNNVKEKGLLAKLFHVQIFPFFLSLNPNWDVNKYVQTLKENGYIKEEEEVEKEEEGKNENLKGEEGKEEGEKEGLNDGDNNDNNYDDDDDDDDEKQEL